MNPFDIINSINVTKQNLVNDEVDEKQYPAYIVNRGLSYYADTVFYAQNINERHGLDSKLQYEYYMNSVPIKKRYSKWSKLEDSELIEAVKFIFGYNNSRAREAISMLDEGSKQTILDSYDKGGVKKKNNKP